MSLAAKQKALLASGISLVVAVVVYVIPFVFVFLTASKPPAEAGQFQFSLPTTFRFFQNIRDVIVYDNGKMIRALLNSLIITTGSVVLIVVSASLVAITLQRRADRLAAVVGAVMLAGLIIPPAVVPTVFLLQRIKLYGSLFGMILVEVAFNIPFAILILRAFVGTIPKELDEAAIVEGASPLQVFFRVLFPLLQPAIVTVMITQSVTIFNDFVGPLYFLPGTRNVTAPLTLFSFMGQFGSQWNLVFADVVVVVVLPFIAFVFFQRQLMAGITSGSIKG